MTFYYEFQLEESHENTPSLPSTAWNESTPAQGAKWPNERVSEATSKGPEYSQDPSLARCVQILSRSPNLKGGRLSRCPGRSLGSVSCCNRVWTEQTQGTLLFPGSDHPPTSFLVTTFGTTSAILSLKTSQRHFSYLNSLLQHNHELPDSSELFPRGGGCGHPLATGTCGPPTCTCPWASISTLMIGSGGCGPLPHTLAKSKGAQHLFFSASLF
uniref:Uncharacterized protein n=1 Tax=Myotis myotis TaxID=51298 RepID=A0A7J7TTV6_MYOMY|nr:hypothetical protein mMyoMyo1_008990 [Myotis myotis]